MVPETVDLTLEAIFAGQDKKSLLFDKPRRYQDENDADDGRRRLLTEPKNKTIYSSNFTTIEFTIEDVIHNAHELGLYDKSLFKSKSDSELQGEVNQCFYNLFGRYPLWFSIYAVHEIHDWNLFESTSAASYGPIMAEHCDCCGSRIHLLNSHYSLCNHCDNYGHRTYQEKLREDMRNSS